MYIVQENERLYAELTLTSKEFKSTKAQLLEDNNKLATELANMRYIYLLYLLLLLLILELSMMARTR